MGIWYLSTLDDFRKRGFASTLLNHILVDAAIKYKMLEYKITTSGINYAFKLLKSPKEVDKYILELPSIEIVKPTQLSFL